MTRDLIDMYQRTIPVRAVERGMILFMEKVIVPRVHEAVCKANASETWKGNGKGRA